MQIEKGKVVSIDSAKKEARVQSALSKSTISMKLGIPKHIADLHIDDLVAYVVFEDQTGLIIGQMEDK